MNKDNGKQSVTSLDPGLMCRMIKNEYFSAIQFTFINANQFAVCNKS